MARSEAPADPRPYVRVSVDLPMNPKLASLDEPAPAGWAYVVSCCYSGQSLTDGHFPVKAVLRMAGVDESVAQTLVEQGLWHLPDHTCERCEQPKPGHAIVHDYLRHQRSGDEARELTNKRREAGRKGAESRWGKLDTQDDRSDRMASGIASAMANGQQEQWQNDGNRMAEERRGEENLKPLSTGKPVDEPDNALFNVDKPPKTQKRRAPKMRPEPIANDDPRWMKLWALYPRRDKKILCRQSLADVLDRGVEFDVIYERVKAFVARERRNETDIKHMPMLVSWLNQERWEDEDDAPATEPAGPKAPIPLDEQCPIHRGVRGNGPEGCLQCKKDRAIEERERTAA